ncbi:MAG: right-handed parallel beta-helix repeat-containing protein, partial [Bacteroidales bacterium]
MKHTKTFFKKSACIFLQVSVIVFISLSIFNPLFSATYYVRTDGNNANTGTGPAAGQAWQTVSKAALVLGPGDIVYVAPGTYTEQVNITISGNPGNKIQYIADTDASEFPGITAGQVILQGNLSIDNGFYIRAASYIAIDGFTIKDSDRDGIFLDTYNLGNCSYVEIKNCSIINAGSSGIFLHGSAIFGTGYFYCNYNDIHNNCIDNAADDGIEVRGGYEDWAITSNTYWNSYNKIYNNSIDCDRYGIYGLYGIDHTDIYNNKITTNVSSGVGIYLPGAHRKWFTIIYNNVVSESDMGIYQWSANSNYSKVLYNSFYTTGTCVSWAFEEAADGDLVEIQNNIFYTTSTSSSEYCLFVWDDVDMVTPVVNYNHYYRSATTNSYAAYTTANVYNLAQFSNWKTNYNFDQNSTWGTDPLFTSAADLHLNSLSPCINTGTPLASYTTDIDGETRDAVAPDIGADEYSLNPQPFTSCTCAPLPVAPTLASVDRNNFCADDAGNISLSVTGGSGTTVGWYTSSCGVTSAGTGNPLVIASPTATTTYYVRWENTCGNSSCQSVTVTVLPLPVAPTLASVDRNNFCADDAGNISLSVTGGSGTTVGWY